MFDKFLKKYAGELRVVGSLFSMVAGGIGLDPNERRKLEEALTSLGEAADRIEAGAKAAASAVKTAKPSKADLKAAFAEIAPELLSDMVEAGVKKALADREAK